MKRRSIRVAAGIALLGAVSAGGAVFAQEKSIEQRLEELDQEVRILKRQQALDKESAAKPKPPVLQADDKGFGFKSADGNFQLKLRGYLQADTAWFLDDEAQNGTDTFQITRARPIIDGTLFQNFDFRIMPDFGRGATTLFDAYVEWKYWPWLQPRIGKFKPPVGLERLQSATANAFITRAFPTSLVPTRDLGLQLGGVIADGVVQYQVGVFNGTLDGGNGDNDNNDGKDYEGRIFVEPFKKTDIGPLQGLGLGIAGTVGDSGGTPSSPNLPTFRTPGQNVFIRYLSGTPATVTNTAFANGQHTRIAPQGYYYWGPFGLMGEYVLSDQEVERRPAGIKTQDHIRNTAWQVTASFVLTGENATFRGVTPQKPFDLKTGGWGAVELVARYSNLRVDPDAFPTYANPTTAAQEARDWGVGVNWYLNKAVKLAVNYNQTNFDGGAAGGGDREAEHAILTRVQLSY
ncbi:MAG: Porin O [Verrucomicrobiae bacterium]|nr:Porin O [Verrucomicrobiae bacterium]